MKKKQGVSGTDIDTILSRSFNLLAVFFDNVYMPTYTNGLKDIAQYFRVSNGAIKMLRAFKVLFGARDGK